MKKKQLIGFAFLSLLLGAGLAGGLYVVNTPTKIAPKAISPILPEPTAILKKPSVKTELSEQAIIDAFGTAAAEFDLNRDGTVNSLDLLEFRKNSLK